MTARVFKRRIVLLIILLFISVFIHFYAENEHRVEADYSRGLYLYISSFLRYVFGWLPFSFGDILYAAISLWLLVKLFRFIFFLFSKEKRQGIRKNFGNGIYKILLGLLLIYIIFNLFWGINYNREGIARQLELDTSNYSKEDLINVNAVLLDLLNDDKKTLIRENKSHEGFAYIKSEVKKSYEEASKKFPLPAYKPASLKPSLWGWVGNSAGFTGYYNPFTGEAQANSTIPYFEQPFTACHEVAHQLGYAKEMEANFVGFLAAINSKDVFFHYSAHMDMFLYTNRNLFRLDSAAAKRNADLLIPAVKKDLQERRDFSLRHRSFLQPIFLFVYEKYLKSNQQPQGLLSYDEVTGFIIAYYKKYRKL